MSPLLTSCNSHHASRTLPSQCTCYRVGGSPRTCSSTSLSEQTRLFEGFDSAFQGDPYFSDFFGRYFIAHFDRTMTTYVLMNHIYSLAQTGSIDWMVWVHWSWISQTCPDSMFHDIYPSCDNKAYDCLVVRQWLTWWKRKICKKPLKQRKSSTSSWALLSGLRLKIAGHPWTCNVIVIQTLEFH